MALIMHLRDQGDLKIELNVEEAPTTCKNFLALAASDFYNGTKFHRNIKGYLIQGGDPTGRGKGGTSIYDGLPFADEIDASLSHDGRGVLAMANNGPNKNLSQFYITYSKQPSLDGKYTIFGRVIDGFGTLDKLEKEAESVDKKLRPLNDLVISSITILANPIADREWLDQ
mmetsp:Transcript_1904/g.3304  ORF Transcript_1904/g.3304 Transcript_1904/m.3304 type:complete len:171 (+) Transcript_1904:32-544(+)